MCGRYVIEDFQELSETLRQIPFIADIDPNPNWNAAPTQTLPVIRWDERDEKYHLVEMHWGLIPRWTKPGEKPKVSPINARSETISEKPMFKGLIKKQRCIVPAHGFYEWKRTGGPKQPFFIHRSDGPIMLFAGLFDLSKDERDEWLPSYTILTGSPNDTMAEIHDRMPTILDPDDASLWLDPDITSLDPLQHLLDPAPDAVIEMYPVSKDVNSVKNNRPELLEPVEAE